MKKIHKFTSDQKLEWWGYGEWVEEPDEVIFEHEGFNCRIIRVGIKDGKGENEYIFGGHLCGYVQVLDGHPWYNVGSIFDAQADVHGGVTFADYNFEEGQFWVGFDCAHSHDIIPSMKMLEKKKPFEKWAKDKEELKKRFPNSLMWNEWYKNIDFCIQECKSLAKQAKEAQEVKR